MCRIGKSQLFIFENFICTVVELLSHTEEKLKSIWGNALTVSSTCQSLTVPVVQQMDLIHLVAFVFLSFSGTAKCGNLDLASGFGEEQAWGLCRNFDLNSLIKFSLLSFVFSLSFFTVNILVPSLFAQIISFAH